MQGKSNANENGDNQNPARRMGSPKSESETFGYNSIGVDQEIGTGRSDRKASDNYDQSEAGTGKILSQLSELEEAFLAYVHGHQDRLEARLRESKAQEARFLQSAVKLKEDILRMVQDAENNST